MKKLSLELNNKKFTAICRKVGKTLWLHYNGKVITYEPKSFRGKAGGTLAEDPKKIIAPMPGKIVKTLVSKGDKVFGGQTLVVMEAMKMEYSLKSHMDGRVKVMNIKLNQQVDLGTVLVELE